MIFNAIIIPEEEVYNTLNSKGFVIERFSISGFPLVSSEEDFYFDECESIDVFLEAMGLVNTILPNDFMIVENLRLYHDETQKEFVLTWKCTK